MEKLIKQNLLIPVYYFEDESGYIILDKEEMKKTFDRKLKDLYNNTKKAKHERFENRYEKSRK
jgi:hypothetical protein